ncbi:MAG: hypothetical protein BA864_14680 [Desulfuromonadales bacterium C00003093]|nr:MAG: hypothetical protein BA864_14680 [Desulfuromonadales bacterium C00003093]
MEFFTCPCPEKGMVVLNGNEQGYNKDENGKIRVFQCGRGLHEVALECREGKLCTNSPQEVMISDTNPITPQEVPFQCGS